MYVISSSSCPGCPASRMPGMPGMLECWNAGMPLVSREGQKARRLEGQAGQLAQKAAGLHPLWLHAGGVKKKSWWYDVVLLII